VGLFYPVKRANQLVGFLQEPVEATEDHKMRVLAFTAEGQAVDVLLDGTRVEGQLGEVVSKPAYHGTVGSERPPGDVLALHVGQESWDYVFVTNTFGGLCLVD